MIKTGSYARYTCGKCGNDITPADVASYEKFQVCKTCLAERLPDEV